MLTPEEKKELLTTARASLAAAISGREYRPEPSGKPGLSQHCGCFVTLRTNGMLRGCIGCFTSDQPLYKTVADYARHSALDDPRFSGRRLAGGELDAVRIDVSVLSPLEDCPEPERIRLGEHGIYVRDGMRSGCFLPQVATETGWTVEEFWGHCCRDKAGLDWDAWRRPGVETKVFTAEVAEEA